jgi:hypothetical protein
LNADAAEQTRLERERRAKKKPLFAEKKNSFVSASSEWFFFFFPFSPYLLSQDCRESCLEAFSAHTPMCSPSLFLRSVVQKNKGPSCSF